MKTSVRCVLALILIPLCCFGTRAAAQALPYASESRRGAPSRRRRCPLLHRPQTQLTFSRGPTALQPIRPRCFLLCCASYRASTLPDFRHPKLVSGVVEFYSRRVMSSQASLNFIAHRERIDSAVFVVIGVVLIALTPAKTVGWTGLTACQRGNHPLPKMLVVQTVFFFICCNLGRRHNDTRRINLEFV